MPREQATGECSVNFTSESRLLYLDGRTRDPSLDLNSSELRPNRRAIESIRVALFGKRPAVVDGSLAELTKQSFELKGQIRFGESLFDPESGFQSGVCRQSKRNPKGFDRSIEHTREALGRPDSAEFPCRLIINIIELKPSLRWRFGGIDSMLSNELKHWIQKARTGCSID